jgi:prephenate dehydrogenase
MTTQTITIVGMDRVGVSMALALRASELDLKLIGHDIRHELAQSAQKQYQAIDKAEWNLVNAVRTADLIVLAIPAADQEETLRVIGTELQEQAVVLDMSPLKQRGVKWAKEYMQQGHYVGVQPVLSVAHLADGRSGPEFASADLFQNSLFCLMPGPYVDWAAVETAVNFGKLLGATPYFFDPAEYDNLMQSVETLPGLLAAALFHTVHSRTGWSDIRRFAGWPFALSTLPMQNAAETTHLALNDKLATLTWLNQTVETLQQIQQWIYDEDAEALTKFMKELTEQRQDWLAERAENAWHAENKPEMPPTAGFTEQLLGSLFGRRGGGDR